jgi:hypothetical protein
MNRNHEDEQENENTNVRLIELSKVNSHNVDNLFFNLDSKQFFTKCKRKIIIEVDDYKPIVWKTISSTYTKKNGDIVNYNYRYINLFSSEDKPISMRLSESELENVELLAIPGLGSKFHLTTSVIM